ncbi:MAG: HAD family hydrolase [Candidatus Delongbacteria bacterium]|nr:HAD family hydrolase [Candidatus Delongbacteria bacterium]
MKDKALFLDRDGTINVDTDYLYKIEDFQFEKNVPEALKFFFDKGYKLIVVTNQSGIARGYYTEEDLKKLHEHIQHEAEKYGFHFTEFYYCPHHRDGVVKKYAIDCECRKPKTFFLKKAAKVHYLTLSDSYFIGDKPADMELGRKMGLTTILVSSGYGKETVKTCKDYDHYIQDFSELKKIIK